MDNRRRGDDVRISDYVLISCIFSSHYKEENNILTTYSGVVGKIETRIQELDAREAKVKETESILAAKVSELAGREKVIEEREGRLAGREKEIGEREKKHEEREEKWEEMEKRMAANATKLESLVHMNVGMIPSAVFPSSPSSALLLLPSSSFPSPTPSLLLIFIEGGERFTAPKSDLLRFNGSYFEAMLTTPHPQHESNNNEYDLFSLFHPPPPPLSSSSTSLSPSLSPVLSFSS